MNFTKPIRVVIAEILIFGMIAGSIWAVIATTAGYEGIYVSPGGKGDACTRLSPCSLETARNKVRTLNQNMQQDLIIWLAGGTYHLDKPILLDSLDAGSNGFYVIYKALPGSTPILGGGQPVGGWQLHDAGKNIYAAPAPAGLEFRQVYINGSRAIRARTPNLEDVWTLGPYYKALSSTYPLRIQADQIEEWRDLKRIELVWFAHWHHRRGRLDYFTVKDNAATVYIQSPENNNPNGETGPLNHHNQNNTFFYFENSYDFLDSPGEWYLDTQTNTLYVIPPSQIDLNTAEVIIPRLETLLQIEGSHHIQFSGITFEYSTWTKPSHTGYLTWQGALQLYTDNLQPIPGAIQLENAHHIRIEDCTIRHTGAHGLVTIVPVHDNTFSGNTFTDLAAGGIVMNATVVRGYHYNELVSHNLIDTFGQDYPEAVGILATLIADSTITHNEVRNGRYTGISIGWSWDDKPTGSDNNEISYNLVHDVMKLLDDGAGIYTLGRMDNTRIQYNYIHSIRPSPYQGTNPIAGIYLDNGSTGKRVEYNVIMKVPEAFYAMNPPNYGNLFRRNYYTKRPGAISLENVLEEFTRFEENEIPQPVLQIIEAAGINKP